MKQVFVSLNIYMNVTFVFLLLHAMGNIPEVRAENTGDLEEF